MHTTSGERETAAATGAAEIRFEIKSLLMVDQLVQLVGGSTGRGQVARGRGRYFTVSPFKSTGKPEICILS